MKKFLFLGICALCVSPALADKGIIKPYVGGGVGFVFPQYNKNLKDIAEYADLDLPSSYFGLGVEAGMNFDVDTKILNHGISFSYDYIFDTDVGNSVVDEKFGFSAWNVAFDNYVRIGKINNNKIDLMFGIGVGNAVERAKSPYYGLLKENSDVVVLKFGTDIQIAEYTDWYTTLRGFIPLEENDDINSIISIQTGLRYNF